MLVAYFVIFFLFCEGYSYENQKCDANEELKCVNICPPETTCRTRGIQVRCAYDENEKCQNKCVCRTKFYRNANKKCVSDAVCDKCPNENEFYGCFSECDNNCETIQFQNRTNCPIKNKRCNLKCYCADGFARNKEGACVPIKDCPQKKCQKTR